MEASREVGIDGGDTEVVEWRMTHAVSLCCIHASWSSMDGYSGSYGGIK